MRNLTNHEKSTILKADRTHVVSELSAFLATNPSSWEPMALRAAGGIENKHKPSGTQALSAVEVSQFLAMAAPTHCANGWAFFSRALYSALVGDAHAAWHFAYYAELRAAQSILSASGCGVFNAWNCVVDSNANCIVVDDPGQKALQTHVMTWRAMKTLLDPHNSASTVLSNSIRFHGAALGDIVSAAFPGTPNWRNTFSWVSSWLFDLAQGVNDKAMRNRCSYQPHELTAHTLSADQSVTFIEHLWDLFTPEPGAPFIGLDKYLLREALTVEAIALLKTRGVPQPNRAEIKAELEIAYHRIASSFPGIVVTKEFLTKDTQRSDPLILTSARDQTVAPITPLPILSRASLFLRLATGVSEQLFSDAGLTDRTQLDFWLNKLALERGFIDSSIVIEDWADLYDDARVATDDLLNLYATGGTPFERSTLLSMNGVQRTCEAERIAFWGLVA